MEVGNLGATDDSKLQNKTIFINCVELYTGKNVGEVCAKCSIDVHNNLIVIFF